MSSSTSLDDEVAAVDQDSNNVVTNDEEGRKILSFRYNETHFK